MTPRSPLQAATLIRRYKRFLALVALPDGTEITVHCPNSGAMRGCSTPGSPVFLSRSDNPRRKTAYTLEIIQEGSTWIGVNAVRANQLVVEAIKEGIIAELKEMDTIRTEVKTSSGSRLDLLLTKGNRHIFVEIKSCSWSENGQALFPDAVTSRGARHLHELITLVNQGHEGIIFFCVLRLDAERFRPASHIDPRYAEALQQAHQQGVAILVYQARVSPQEICIVRPLPFSFH
jgi:sugar fermentation stimulation protein A